ncbi:hypothetical protein [Anabaena lutea]|uniref:Nitrate transport protein n=1 Tax=Anabaena lutea FACHB-196 TaxID=2692881 RepID=A0ABR8FQI8_9NOST|nr:hypothetical protein [Anabaena lutea]MBD2571165.1 hypothetical protein [Anabaena lutea FACHB-196]
MKRRQIINTGVIATATATLTAACAKTSTSSNAQGSLPTALKPPQT